MKLEGRVAIVTGGSQGIGAAIAMAYGREGARVAIVNKSNRDRARQVVEAIAAGGGTARAFAADCSDLAEIDRMVAAVAEAFGPADILVNNAGLFEPLPIEEIDEDNWDRQLGLNLKGAFFLVKAVTPAMKAKRHGKIINITSIAGDGGFPNSAPYCASKGGLNNLTKALCLELAPFGINVNAIAPGNIVTPLNADLRADEGWSAKVRERTPTGEDFLPAEDMAGAAVYLASDAGGFMTGQTLVVDGGVAVA